jgi:hypothetical protein
VIQTSTDEGRELLLAPKVLNKRILLWTKSRRVRVIAILAVIAFLILFISTQSTLAYGSLVTDSSETVWFYRACNDAETVDVGSWTIVPNPVNSQELMLHLTNVYPGYHLSCALYLANAGAQPLRLNRVEVSNLSPSIFTVTAQATGGTIESCGFKPAWDTPPANLPANCRAEISLNFAIQPDAQQNSRYGFQLSVDIENMP